jgi:hypothetical protein
LEAFAFDVVHAAHAATEHAPLDSLERAVDLLELVPLDVAESGEVVGLAVVGNGLTGVVLSQTENCSPAP